MNYPTSDSDEVSVLKDRIDELEAEYQRIDTQRKEVWSALQRISNDHSLEEEIDRLEAENESFTRIIKTQSGVNASLRSQIDRMKNCQNCAHDYNDIKIWKEFCHLECVHNPGLQGHGDNWTLQEEDINHD